MIEPILKELEEVVNAEFHRIIEEHGYLHSRHEGIGVGLEEEEELFNEIYWVKEYSKDLKRSVFEDEPSGVLMYDLTRIERHAKYAAAEAVQVAAVAMKFRLLLDHETLKSRR